MRDTLPPPGFSALTINAFVPFPHEKRSQQQQQQADTHTAHNEACVVLLLGQRHLAQISNGVRLAPLQEVKGFGGLLVRGANFNNS